MQKREEQDRYTVYLKGTNDISIKYIEQTLYPTFNIELMDFWPEDDNAAMELANSVYNLHNLRLTLPTAYIIWFPRLMYSFEGSVSIFGTNDAKFSILIANLASTTMMTGHVVFSKYPAQGF